MLITRGSRIRTSLVPNFLLVDSSFNRCRKKKREQGQCKIAKNILENRTDLAKTAVDRARLDHRANNTKGENFRSPKTEGSVKKQHSSFATVQKKNQEAVRHPLTTKILST